MSSKSKKFHNWALDFGSGVRESRGNLSAPVGFVEARGGQVVKHQDPDPSLIVKRSWDIALGPLKQIPMNLFIMWMSGNTISIFPIMMVGMMFWRPLQAMLTIQNTLKMIEGDQAFGQKLTYFLGNLACLALAIYKCKQMGLLPTEPSDWLAFEDAAQRLEYTGGGLVL